MWPFYKVISLIDDVSGTTIDEQVKRQNEISKTHY
jgi:hypothetical protein